MKLGLAENPHSSEVGAGLARGEEPACRTCEARYYDPKIAGGSDTGVIRRGWYVWRVDLGFDFTFRHPTKAAAQRAIAEGSGTNRSMRRRSSRRRKHASAEKKGAEEQLMTGASVVMLVPIKTD